MPIETYHVKNCPAQHGRRCTCGGRYQATVNLPRQPGHRQRKVRRTFRNRPAAEAWERDTRKAALEGQRIENAPVTIQQLWDEFLPGIRTGAIRTRSGEVYRTSTLESYRRGMTAVLREFGTRRAADLTTAEISRFASGLTAEGKNASTVRNMVMPLRALYGWAVHEGRLSQNPTRGARMPAVRSRRERIATVTEAHERLLLFEHREDRVAWALAFWAGLRRGEIMALRWSDVDLARGTIRVRASRRADGEVTAPKTAAGTRTVPLVGALRDLVDDPGEGLVLPGFSLNVFRKRTVVAWSGLPPLACDAEADEPSPLLTPHEARHTFASTMIAAGVNAHALSKFMGHASIGTTLDLYGHLIPGGEAEAAELLDAYLTAQLERQEEQARAAA